MPNLVRARIGDRAVNVSPEYAEANGLEVLDEPTHGEDGRIRPETRVDGRPVKPKTSVAEAAAAKKKAGQPTAASNPPSEEN